VSEAQGVSKESLEGGKLPVQSTPGTSVSALPLFLDLLTYRTY
jgi:hypothetical protein